MARSVGVQSADTWIYIDDKDGDTVKALPPGAKPPEDGSYFRIVPTPFDLVLEAVLSIRGAARSDKPAKVMSEVLKQSIGGWSGVRNGDGKDIAFQGPESVKLLPPYEANLLAAWIYNEVLSDGGDPETGKHSGTSPEGKRSSGAAGAGSATASTATRKGRRTKSRP